MRKTLLIFCMLFSVLCFSQSKERLDIKGKVVVDSNDIEGITVYNSSSNQGTITNEKGEFIIKAGLNDRIEFSALQFKDFVIVIDETILRTKQMTVYLVEQVNKLDEILILPYDLTGNLESDIASVRTFNPDMDAIFMGIERSDEFEFADDRRSEVKNTALHSQSEPMFVNGLNVINVAKLLISPLLHEDDRKLESENILEFGNEQSKLKNFYSISFISNNFDIPTERVDEFIQYLEKNGLNERLVTKGKEVELLQFMYSKRDEFLSLDVTKD